MIFDSFVFFKCVFFFSSFCFCLGGPFENCSFIFGFFQMFFSHLLFSFDFFVYSFFLNYLLNFVFLNCWIHLFKGFVLFVCECCIFFSFLKG